MRALFVAVVVVGLAVQPLGGAPASAAGAALLLSTSSGGGSKTSAAPESAPHKHPKPASYPDTALVHLGPADAGTRAFVAFPSGTAPAASVIVVHEWWGLNAQIREQARRLARQGYVAIVPDLYHGKSAGDPETAHELMRGLDEDQSVRDLAAAVEWLKAEPRTAKRNYGVMGFCMGGHLAELLAFQDPALSAVVVFYGTPETRPDRIASLKAPLLGHYGAEDQGIDTSRVAAFRQSLVNAGKRSEVYVYLGAGHAFMNQEQPSYRPDSAQLAWARTLGFLQKYLKGLS